MFTVDLECENGHKFEGWYDNRAEYEQIVADDDLTCPLCETHQVHNTMKTGGAKTSKTAARQERQRIQMEYVGERFADEATDMWTGEIPHRNIRGTVSDQQGWDKLRKNRVPVMAIAPIEPDPQDIH